jgi:hypothetical protein
MIPQKRVNESAETANDYMTPGNHRAFNDGFDCGVRFAEAELKHTAIEFAEWKELNGWRKSDLKDCFIWHKDKKWHKKGDKYKLTPEQSDTTAELFAKFEAERNQQQSELTCPECLSNRILEWPDKYQCRKCEHVWERSVK